MTYLKPALALAAAMSLTACMPGATTTTISTPGEEPVVVVDGPPIAPAAPVATSGVEGADSMNGTWNLVASQCGDPASEGRMVIAGNKFTFPTTECTATGAEVQTNYTSLTLGCSSAENRQLNVSLRPGRLRVTEGATTLTYYQCS
ncbi:hypothetical protein [Paracoccus luteus]|uniref:hypothetical protein n=1 Tax=Paracoccus luteus TaxID=2508543 RepID=UPI001FE4ACA4|nr:hypothetical protein [Paracoccus luteus]